MKKILIATLIVAISSLGSTLIPASSNALSLENACTDVEVIFARGSGQTVNQERVDARVFFEQVRSRISNEISVQEYELGSEEYSTYQTTARSPICPQR